MDAHNLQTIKDVIVTLAIWALIAGGGLKLIGSPFKRVRRQIEKEYADKRLQNMETGVVRGSEQLTYVNGSPAYGYLYVSALPSVAVNRKLTFMTGNNREARIKNNAAFFAANVGDTICYLNPDRSVEIDCITYNSPNLDNSVISINGVPVDSIYKSYENRIRREKIQKVQDEYIRSLPRQR